MKKTISGRQEEELRIENKIEKILKNNPSIFCDYYNSFMSETYNTKLNYIKQIILFSNYVKEKYNIDFNNINNFKDIKVLHINNFLKDSKYKQNNNEIQNSTSYIANKLSALRHFFEFLNNNDIIDVNICNKIKTPKDNTIHEIISLTPEEIQIIKHNILNGVGCEHSINCQKKWTNRDLSIIMLGITTGLRVSAICNINLEDINTQNKTIKVVEKGNISKNIFVPDNVLSVINHWIDEREKLIEYNNTTNALFISTQRKRITTNAVRNLLKKYTYNIDKRITPHKLRSTAATNLYESTNDIYLVAEVLGHKNLQNTKRYAALSDKRKIDAAELLGKLL